MTIFSRRQFFPACKGLEESQANLLPICIWQTIPSDGLSCKTGIYNEWLYHSTISSISENNTNNICVFKKNETFSVGLSHLNMHMYALWPTDVFLKYKSKFLCPSKLTFIFLYICSSPVYHLHTKLFLKLIKMKKKDEKNFGKKKKWNYSYKLCSPPSKIKRINKTMTIKHNKTMMW
jgi:hypothetical protein